MFGDRSYSSSESKKVIPVYPPHFDGRGAVGNVTTIGDGGFDNKCELRSVHHPHSLHADHVGETHRTAAVASSAQTVRSSPFGGTGRGGSLARGLMTAGTPNDYQQNAHDAPAAAGGGKNTAGGLGVGGFGMDRMVNQLVVNTVRENLGVSDSEISNAKSIFPAFILSLKSYFAVSHAYVGMRLLALMFPYIFILKEKQLAAAYRKKNKSMRMDSLADSDILMGLSMNGNSGGKNNFSSSSPNSRNLSDSSFSSSSSSSSSMSGNQCSSAASFSFSAFFSNSMKIDLYIPLMAFMTYVLVFCLARGAANDFSPELLGSTASFAFILLALEVIVMKVACYLSSMSHISVLDLIASSGYKYVNLVFIVLLGMFAEWALLPSVQGDPAFLSDVGGINKVQGGGGGEGTAAGQGGNIGEGKTIDERSAHKAGGNTRSSWQFFNNDSLVRNSSFFYLVGFLYLTICVSLEMYRNLTYLKSNVNEENNNYMSDNNYSDASHSSHSSQLFFRYVIVFVVLSQVPLCWLLVPSFHVKK